MIRTFCISLMVACSLFSCQFALARNIIVGVSPYQDAETHGAQVKQLLKYLVSLEAGSQAVIVDAYNAQLLGTFTIPEKKSYASEKARIQFNGKVIKRLLDLPLNSGVRQVPLVSAAIHFPNTLRYVADNFSYLFSQGEDKELIIFGSPIFDDPSEPELSMQGFLVPNDGMINAPLSRSVFGTKGREDYLTGWRVHWATLSHNHFTSKRHEYYVTRFWSLYLGAMSAQLVSFEKDIDVVLKGFENKKQPTSQRYDCDIHETEMRMLRIERQSAKLAIFERTLATNPLARELIKNAENVELGMSWRNCLCDVDVVAKPSANSEVLYFARRKTKEGEYFKDIRSVVDQFKNVVEGEVFELEVIQFSVPINLEELKIAVKLYSGNPASTSFPVEVRLTIAGKTYAKEVMLSAEGLRSLDADSLFDRPINAPFIAYINPFDIVRL